MSKIYVPKYWTENWGWWEWLRKWLVEWELHTKGHWTMCEHGSFSPPDMACHCYDCQRDYEEYRRARLRARER